MDVHWRIGIGYGARVLTCESLLLRTQPRSLLGQKVQGPSAADTLLITCIHGSRHRWHTVEAVLGLGVQLLRTPEDAWSRVLSTARRAGCVRSVCVGVAHVGRMLAIPIPPEVARKAAEDVVSRLLLTALTPSVLEWGAPQSGRGQLSEVAWTLAMEESLHSAVEHAAVRGLCPSTADWSMVTLPGHAEWLHFPMPDALGLEMGAPPTCGAGRGLGRDGAESQGLQARSARTVLVRITEHRSRYCACRPEAQLPS